jgi:hypothetical protein
MNRRISGANAKCWGGLSLIMLTFVISCGGTNSESSSEATSFSSLADLVTSFERDVAKCGEVVLREEESPPFAYCLDSQYSSILSVYFPGSEYGVALEVLTFVEQNRGSFVTEEPGRVGKTELLYGPNWVVFSESSEVQSLVENVWNGDRITFENLDELQLAYELVKSNSTTGGLDEIVPACLFENSSLSMDGRSAKFETGPRDSSGVWEKMSLGSVLCVLFSLQIPDYVVDLILTTRSSDGRQDSTWDEYQVSWRFDNTNGFEVLLAFTG